MTKRSIFWKTWKVLQFSFSPFVFPYLFFVLGFSGGLVKSIPVVWKFDPNALYISVFILTLAVLLFFDRLYYKFSSNSPNSSIDFTEARKIIRRHESPQGKREEFFAKIFASIQSTIISVFLMLFVHFIAWQAFILWFTNLFGNIDLGTIVSYIPVWLTVGTSSLFEPVVTLSILAISLIIFANKFIDPVSYTHLTLPTILRV